MKRKHILILLAAVLGLFLLLAGVFFIWKHNTFLSPGIHTWGDSTHMEMQKTVYIFDLRQNNQQIGQSVVGVFGTYSDHSAAANACHFRGLIEIRDYPIPISEASAMYTNDGKGFPGMAVGKYLYHVYTGVKPDAAGIGSDNMSDYYYEVYWNPDEPAQMIIMIRQTNSDLYLAAVTAADETEAAKRLNDCLANIP